MLWLFWVVHLLIFCISISFSHLSYRFIKSVTELKNIKLSWPCQSAVGYYHSHDNNLKFYVVYDYILDANLSLRRPPMFHSGLWGTPSGGPCRSGDHQCSIWPVRSAFGWSVLHLRSLKGAVSTEGKHPWCMGKSAHLWEQMSLRFYVMMKAFRIPFRYFYFFSADRHKNAFKICVLRYFLTFRMSFLWLCARHKTIWNLVACVCMWSLKLCGVTCVRPKGTPSDAAAICPEGSIT